MYCPKCSQLQSSEEMRFCSRCGFPLAGVAMLLENDGSIPQLAATPGKPLPLSRKRLMAESVLLTALSWAVAFGGMLFSDVGGPLGDVATIAGVIFFLLGMIGLLRFLYGFLFKKDHVAHFETNVLPGKPARVGLPETSLRGSLPGPRSVSATDYTPRVNTKEIARPPSVTENTTRLLEEPPIDRSE